ncbi:MAG TPA: hypothetical protein VEK84_17370 [Terriglobales bacterium]|nr:hypothetical protein [Terriglobales bacterium]
MATIAQSLPHSSSLLTWIRRLFLYLPGPARHVAEALAFFAIKFAPPQAFFSALAILYVDA